MIVGAFFLKYSSQSVLQLRSTSSSTCALLTDSNDDKDLAEEINLSSNSLIVCRWVTVRPGKNKVVHQFDHELKVWPLLRHPPPQLVSLVFVLLLLLFLVHQFVHFERVDTGHSNPQMKNAHHHFQFLIQWSGQYWFWSWSNMPIEFILLL